MSTKRRLVPASLARQTNGLTEDGAREAGFLSKETVDFVADFFRRATVWISRAGEGFCPLRYSLGRGGCPECQAALKEPNRYGPVAVSPDRPPHLFELKDWLRYFFGASEGKLDRDLTLG